jgi:hypothetical protein
MSFEKAHRVIDKLLHQANREGFGYGYLEGEANERKRIVDILRAIGAQGVQYVLDTSEETYQAEQTMSTDELVHLIESDND